MKLTVLEKDANRLKIEVSGEGHTLLNLLSENAWQAGATQASVVIEHPYLSAPRLLVRGQNPKKILVSAAELAENQAKEFQTEFKRAAK